MTDAAPVLEELILDGIDRDTALTIGVFDGVHRGHRYLLDALKQRAAARGLATGVITLHPHPALVLNPRAGIVYLTTLEGRVSLLRRSGVALVLPLTFTAEIAHLSARDFLTALRERLRLRFLLTGPDFALGRERGGGGDTLARLGGEMGFEVESLGPLIEDGLAISSTAVRTALEEGDVAKAGRLLGRPFTLHGPVVHGVERGGVIGFPTANIAVGPGMALPSFGVYVSRARVGGHAYNSVTNIGRRPTFDNGERTVEVHIMDFAGDIYGKEMRIDLLKRLRGEVRFADADALSEQIGNDVVAARQYLETASQPERSGEPLHS